MEHLKRGKAIHGKERLFAHFRAVGRLTNGIPHVLDHRGGVPFLTTVTGRSFQIFDVQLLKLIFFDLIN